MPLPPIHRWENAANPRAAVHILHGMAEHGARYARLAEALNRSGLVVWAHDHRGHGEHPDVRGHFADTNGWRALIDDAWAVSAHMAATFPGLPLVLFAHSMGSFIGQTLMAERGTGYRAVVLSGTNGSPGAGHTSVRILARLQRTVRGGRQPGTWLDSLVLGNYNKAFAPNRTRVDWLSRDGAEVDRYVNDPLCGFSLTAQAWQDLLEGQPVLGTNAHLQRIPKALPVLVMAGTSDPVGERIKGVNRLLHQYAGVGLSNVSHRFYDDARHEIVNETNRQQVTDDLVEWINSVV
jgi:alpha-beta hydrolase superfamily lysophospholipase